MAISEQQVRIYNYVKSRGGWLTSREVARGANVAPRTARAWCRAFVAAGAFAFLETHNGYRYRIVQGHQSDALAAASAALGV